MNEPEQLPVPIHRQAYSDISPLDINRHTLREHVEPEESFETSTLEDYFRALKRHKFAIGGLALLGLLISLVFTLQEPLVFAAKTTVEVQNLNENFMRLSEVDPQSGSYTATEYNIQTQLRVLDSASLKRRVLERLEREAIPLPPPPDTYLTKLRSKFQRSTPDIAEYTKEALQMAAFTVHSVNVRATRIIEVQCQSTHPVVAANFVNALIREYMDQTTEERVGGLLQTGKWLTGRLEESKIKLEQAEMKLQAYARRNGLLVGPSQETLAESKVRQLQSELAIIQADRIAKQSRWELSQRSAPDALPSDHDAGLEAYRQQLATLRREMAAVSTTYTPQHPKVQKIQVQIQEIEGTLRAERDAVLNRLKTEYETAQRREQLLSGAYGTQSSRMAYDSEKAVEYNMLKREADGARQLYNALLQQANQSGVASSVQANQIHIVDPAVPSQLPVKPDPIQNAAVGLAGGLVMGIVFAFVRSHGDKTLRNPEHISRLLNLPGLSVIPAAPQANFGSRLPGRNKGPSRPGVPQFGAAESTAVLTLAHSMFAESFRLAIASFLIATERLGRSPVVVITSPHSGEGKTTMIGNLALALADTNRRVLLIDFDLRRSSLQHAFNLEGDYGLVNVIESAQPIWDVDLHSAIKPTLVPQLSVMIRGSEPRSLTRLIHSERVSQLLERVRQQFDVVLIDTPPVLMFPDARMLGRMSDGAILVLRAGVTDRNAALAVRRQMQEDGTPILSTLLNDCDISDSPNYKGYASYYGTK